VSALVPFRPFTELADVERQFNRMFRTMFDGRQFVTVPSVDVRDAGEKVEIVAELPGFTPEEVEVTVREGILAIEASHKTSTDENTDGYVWRERRASRLSRRLRLPQGVGADDVSATLENGLLTVSVPKAKDAATVRVPVLAEQAPTAEKPAAPDTK
jgi:HSP20 family protein